MTRRVFYDLDQLIHGLGRCCAEHTGLIVIRHRFPHQQQAGESLLDHLPDGKNVEPFPQVRIDVAGLNPTTAHTKIVEHVRSMMSDPDGKIAAGSTTDITAAVDDAFRGLIAILERHAPDHDAECSKPCVDSPGYYYSYVPWPCADYRDAAAGLATGLPEQVSA